MFDIAKIREDFPMLHQKQMQKHQLVYLDNSATSLKPRKVIDAVLNYYENFSVNAHRADYDLSYFVDQEYDAARSAIARFIHAEKNEVVFTSGTSEALNYVAYGYKKFIQKGDIILSSQAEHASCILPWMRVAQEKGAIIKYIPLDKEGRISIPTFQSVMNEKVKVIALAQISNVLGNQVPIKEICEIAHRNHAIVVVDGAQSAPHIPIDVKALDCDFFAFSAHKMCGPTGIGALYGKIAILSKLDVMMLGGDSNARYYSDGEIILKDVPYRFESGTQPIEAIFGFHAAIQYLEAIGMQNIHEYEKQLHAYAIEKMQTMEHIIILNPNNDTGIITFNIKDVFAQDAASYFNAFGIAVRSGQHCAKLLNDFLQSNATIRASMYFYTSKAEIDIFLDVCSHATKKSCLDIFFQEEKL